MHSSFSSFLRGMYFIRFGAVLWLLVAGLGPLDHWTGVSTATRGILTPENSYQAMTAAFMVFSAGMVILLIVRVVALNGEERFETARQTWLHKHLGQKELPLWLFGLAHLAGVVLLGFVVRNMHCEGVVPWPTAVLWLGLGLFVAYWFWVLVGFVYLWTFPSAAMKVRSLGANGIADEQEWKPREILFARWVIGWVTDDALRDIWQTERPPFAGWVEPVFRRIAKLGKGFADRKSPTVLYEGHRLAFFALLGLAVLYGYFFSFSSPVRIVWAEWWMNGLAVAALLYLLLGSGLTDWTGNRTFVVMKGVFTGILLVLLGCVFWASQGQHDPTTFSVLGSVLILLVGIFWLLATIAFMADGTRFPVFLGTFVILFTVKAYMPNPGEHFFTVVVQSHPLPKAPSPKDVLTARLGQLASSGTGSKDELPTLIVVTATGGGIHSQAWTAAVLAEIETEFRQKNPSDPELFRHRLLLLSGVSGGSVGMMNYLREAYPPQQADGLAADGAMKRLMAESTCSDLQAVAWGLTYHDALNVLIPLPDWLNPPGVTAKGQASTGLDRSWALERAFDRNLGGLGCDPRQESADYGYTMTLGDAAERAEHGTMPAFTFNATTVETGSRFLFANYDLDNVLSETDPVAPAESFLGAYGYGARHTTYADLPMAAAARLSATFTYVSSASRIPKDVTEFAYHFIDGGYYDNDGTLSAIEFLRYAVDGGGVPQGKTLPILWVEIRNGPDVSGEWNPDAYVNQVKAKGKDWGPLDQITAPPFGLYSVDQAGVTQRDRREMVSFEKAYGPPLRIHHIVLDFHGKEDEVQPLSWHLTPKQKNAITASLNACGVKSIDSMADEALEWLNDPKDVEEPGKRFDRIMK